MAKQSVYGQPTADTHPHLLKEDEILPSIQKTEFMQRRTNLMDLIKKHMLQTNHDVHAHIVSLQTRFNRSTIIIMIIISHICLISLT